MPEFTTPPSAQDRDLRVDFFRGFALWFIFLDHIPSNVMSWVTMRNFGFADATEVFVFISGYSAALAYGRVMQRQGFGFALANVWHRVWQLYVAHLVLFMFYTAQVAYVAARFSNPMYVDEINIAQMIEAPHLALIHALLLRFRPVNMDVLPLYIVLLLSFPLALPWLRRQPLAVFAASLALYVAARVFEWNLPTYPAGDGWYFNPFAWQLLFIIGALCAAAPERVFRWVPWNRWLARAAALYLVFSLLIVLSWQVPLIDSVVPDWLSDVLYPIDKTNLDVLRLAHFLALAYLAARAVKPDAAFLRWGLVRPLIECGRQSLYVFCVGIFLSFATHFVLVETGGSTLTQIVVSVAGIAILTMLAIALNWYKRIDLRSRKLLKQEASVQ